MKCLSRSWHVCVRGQPALGLGRAPVPLHVGGGAPRTELSLVPGKNPSPAQEYQLVCQQLGPGKLGADAAGRTDVGP